MRTQRGVRGRSATGRGVGRGFVGGSKWSAGRQEEVAQDQKVESDGTEVPMGGRERERERGPMGGRELGCSVYLRSGLNGASAAEVGRHYERASEAWGETTM